MGTGDGRRYVIPPRLWAWAATPQAASVFLWLVALAVAVHHLRTAHYWLANYPDMPEHQRRPDPEGQAHTQIDFGGQWVMARMLVTGHGRELYHRQRQWELVQAAYPESAEAPVQREEAILPKYRRKLAKPDEDIRHDADWMMYWFMGADPPAWKTVGGAVAAPLAAAPFGNPLAAVAYETAAADAVTPAVVEEVEKPAIGGPLYPPIQAFFYSPLGLFDRPKDALAVFRVIAVGLSCLAGLGISRLTGGRVWWSLATVAVLLYPGSRVGIQLGQNPVLSLCIAVWGWVLVARGREWAGGAVWGLLAFKPVWGMAFFLVPLLMGRWRVCVGMVATGAGLAALTLPVVGIQAWFDWLQVGAEGAALYNRSLNWINLSRDLQGIPRRFLHDFTLPEDQRETPLAKALAWALWGVVFATTVLVYRLRADRRKAVGLGAAFLFLGAFLSCYRFMYYDVLLSLVGVACLFAEPWRLFRTRVFGLSPAAPLSDPERELGQPSVPAAPFGSRVLGYVNSFPLTVLAGLFILDNVLTAMGVEATVGVLAWEISTTAADGSTGLATPRVRADTTILYPWDTVLVIGLWMWCGVRLLMENERKLGGDKDTGPPRNPLL